MKWDSILSLCHRHWCYDFSQPCRFHIHFQWIRTRAAGSGLGAGGQITLLKLYKCLVNVCAVRWEQAELSTGLKNPGPALHDLGKPGGGKLQQSWGLTGALWASCPALQGLGVESELPLNLWRISNKEKGCPWNARSKQHCDSLLSLGAGIVSCH